MKQDNDSMQFAIRKHLDQGNARLEGKVNFTEFQPEKTNFVSNLNTQKCMDHVNHAGVGF